MGLVSLTTYIFKGPFKFSEEQKANALASGRAVFLKAQEIKKKLEAVPTADIHADMAFFRPGLAG